MKFHRHAQHLAQESLKKDAPRGYMHCDLCGCKPTSGTAGDPPADMKSDLSRNHLNEAAPVDPLKP